MLQIHLLGSVIVQRNGEPPINFFTRKEVALAVYLACTGQAYSRELLADLLWDDRSPERAQSNLRTVLSYLRRDLGPYLVVTRKRVALDPRADVWLDVAEFQTQLAAARDDWRRGKRLSGPVAERLGRALELYRGDFLAGFHVRSARRFEEWVTLQRESLQRDAIEGLRALTDFYLQIHRYATGIETATRLLTLAPFDETAHRQMMTLLALDGQRSAALGHYANCREILRRELGVEPEAETVTLHEQIYGGALGWDVKAGVEPRNPYKGLRPFEETDAVDFFGREALVEHLLARWQEGEARFLAVVGPSGSGKSSVVQAGLVPALRRGARLPGSANWVIAQMRPGAQPLEELAAALGQVSGQAPPDLLAGLQADERGLLRTIDRILPARDDVALALVVDQFEELFALVEDEARRAHFLENLYLAATDPGGCLWLLIALRADFYDRLLRYPEFGELLVHRNEVVLPLTPQGLELAIVGPATRVGVVLEAGLATTIISDIRYEPGYLPLLQYTLTELFEQRQGRTLTQAAYQASGGVHGAHGRRAEALYAELDEIGQAATRHLFLRLVAIGERATLGQTATPTRRRVLRSELAVLGDDAGAVAAVMDLFGRHRLLTFDHDPAAGQPTVELAHEAFVQAWPRLHDWIELRRDAIRLRQLLGILTQSWVQAERSSDFLIRGGLLDLLAEWAATTDLALTQHESTYLQTSLVEGEQRHAEVAHSTSGN